ncbi:hypothetical protein TVA88_08855 [Aeromonas hydrophila]|uniref:hypothetical protein n=1 Tax=Aeromonas hydrophila TaxID=644 RepID=UPI0005376E07|nr:hypothetical protein [Aeromonas hydrophila]KHA54403.1 hypothetical protein NM74_22215 [Aeromonas hydrophila]MBL0434345.1 hypothetical protein [Aeromonas hydrophila]MBL0470294.1 hypothetical protein [Aeromonas hydrophila]HCT5133224.1 hypothetical protein [Aeromonas hydrophila]
MDKRSDHQEWPGDELLARYLAEADAEGFIDFKVFCRALDVSASALAGFFHERDRFYDSPEMVALRDGLNHRVEWRERKRRDGTSHEPARFVVKRAQIHQDDLARFLLRSKQYITQTREAFDRAVLRWRLEQLGITHLH